MDRESFKDAGFFRLSTTIALAASVIYCNAGNAQCGAKEKNTPNATKTSAGPEKRPIKQSVNAQNLRDRLWKNGSKGVYRELPRGDRDRLARTLEQIARYSRSEGNASAKEWGNIAKALGLVYGEWKLGNTRFVGLMEVGNKRRGIGSYLFRIARPRAREILLQAPHAYFDLGTGELALKLFSAPQTSHFVRALFTNSLHRYRDSRGERKQTKNAPADVCHNPSHPFSAATSTIDRLIPNLEVVQLHGFGKLPIGKNRTAAPLVIVSNGTPTKTPRTTQITVGLRSIFPRGVYLYGEDVRTLGATTNVQGRSVRRKDHTGFLHIELSRTARRKLLRDPRARSTFASVLLGGRG